MPPFIQLGVQVAGGGEMDKKEEDNNIQFIKPS